MNLSLRTRIFVIAGAAILVIAFVVLFILVSKNKISLPFLNKTQNGAEKQAADIVETEEQKIMKGIQAVPLSDVEAQKKGVQQFAKIFLERLNSYSSESNFENIKDIKSMVTDSMYKELSANVSTPSAGTQFYAKSIDVYSTKLVSFSATTAQVDLLVKISENKNGQTSDKNQEAKVSFEKHGNDWLVSKYEWVK